MKREEGELLPFRCEVGEPQFEIRASCHIYGRAKQVPGVHELGKYENHFGSMALKLPCVRLFDTFSIIGADLLIEHPRNGNEREVLQVQPPGAWALS